MSPDRRTRRQSPGFPGAAIACACALGLAGCAPSPALAPPATPPGVRAPAAPARPRPGYDARRDPLDRVDAAALAGRRVALDPGHGGFFRGSLGVNGLSEAEVNLGVALHLRGLLEARGAVVFMTRTDDRDFLTPADSSLRADLAERSRLANAFGPDLFVSIHHNADARGAHDVNETQTYYRLGDEGPSLDAAGSVHRYLVRNLGIEKHRILPGNYFVLRNSEAPALLTEASYLTNPDVESKLALAAKQRLEAEALFLGIAHWFARPRPAILDFAARDAAGGGRLADTLFADGDPELHARIRGPFDRVVLELDGRPVRFHREAPTPGGAGDMGADGDSGYLALLGTGPLALPPGVHRATLEVGLAGAGTARAGPIVFHVRRPPHTLVADVFPPAGTPATRLLAVRVRVEDVAGFPCPDSFSVRIAGGRAVEPRETTVVARDGVAWAYFRRRVAAGSSPIEFTPHLAGRAGLAARRARFATGYLRGWLGKFLSVMPGDSALRPPGPVGGDVSLSAAAAPWVNRDGFALLPRDEKGRAIPPRLVGFRAWAGSEPDPSSPPARWVAIAGGALHGRRIVLDPDGGGDDDGGTGPGGTRAAQINLDVARALAAFLEAAGAEVRLTRGGDFAMSEVERVEVSEAFRAERFLRIGHRAEPPMLGHYYSSAAGRRWAARTAEVLGRLGLPAPAVAEDAQYPLQQTSCPALYVSTARVDDAAAEERFLSPAAARAEAYALFVALAREWTDAAWPVDSVRVVAAGGAPAAGAVVTLGDAFVHIAGADGLVRFARTEPGPVGLAVDHPRVRSRRVLLDSESGIVVTGSAER